MTSSGYYRTDTLAEQRAMQATSLDQQGGGRKDGQGYDRLDREWEPALMMPFQATQPQEYPQPAPDFGPGPCTGPAPGPGPGSSSLNPNFETNPYKTHPRTLSPSYATYPINPSNPFDAILPRGLLYHLIDLYFDYIYCLVPCLHRPSFTADLHRRREDRPGEEEWTAMVYMIVASTLIQLPRAFIPMPRRDVKMLAERLYGLGREYLARDFKEYTVSRCEL